MDKHLYFLEKYIFVFAWIKFKQLQVEIKHNYQNGGNCGMQIYDALCTELDVEDPRFFSSKEWIVKLTKSCQLQSFKIHKNVIYYNLHIFDDI